MSAPPYHQMWTCWLCPGCDVGGRDPRGEDGALPSCWNCGGRVEVITSTMLPTLPGNLPTLLGLQP